MEFSRSIAIAKFRTINRLYRVEARLTFADCNVKKVCAFDETLLFANVGINFFSQNFGNQKNIEKKWKVCV